MVWFNRLKCGHGSKANAKAVEIAKSESSYFRDNTKIWIMVFPPSFFRPSGHSSKDKYIDISCFQKKEHKMFWNAAKLGIIQLYRVFQHFRTYYVPFFCNNWLLHRMPVVKTKFNENNRVFPNDRVIKLLFLED